MPMSRVMKKQPSHETHIRVRYQETDQMGVVYHSNYLNYFEIGRTELLRTLGLSYREIEARGYLLAVTEIQMKIHASAFYDDLLLVRTKVEGYGPASIRFQYEISHRETGREIASGSTSLACLNAEKRPQRLPKELLACLQPKE